MFLCLFFFLFNIIFKNILLGCLCVLFASTSSPIKEPLHPSKCVSDSSHPAIIPRPSTSSGDREGPQLGAGGVSDGHHTGRGTDRPFLRGPAELGASKVVMPQVPRGSGSSGTPASRGRALLTPGRGAGLCPLGSPSRVSLS